MPDPFRVTVLRPTSAGSSLVGLFTFGFSKGSTPVTFHNCCLIACKKTIRRNTSSHTSSQSLLTKNAPVQNGNGINSVHQPGGFVCVCFPGFPPLSPCTTASRKKPFVATRRPNHNFPKTNPHRRKQEQANEKPQRQLSLLSLFCLPLFFPHGPFLGSKPVLPAYAFFVPTDVCPRDLHVDVCICCLSLRVWSSSPPPLSRLPTASRKNLLQAPFVTELRHSHHVLNRNARAKTQTKRSQSKISPFSPPARRRPRSSTFYPPNLVPLRRPFPLFLYPPAPSLSSV